MAKYLVPSSSSKLIHKVNNTLVRSINSNHNSRVNYFSTLNSNKTAFFSTPQNPANNTSVLTNQHQSKQFNVPIPINSVTLNQSVSNSPFHHVVNHIQSSTTASGLVVPSFPCNKSAVQKLFRANSGANKERAFFINDIGTVERQYNRWVKELPMVKPFYAVKCNPDETLLKVLSGMGAGFDCASGAEMELALATGTECNEIIFANPIKNSKDLRFAAKSDILKMTFDNEAELYKIKEHCPNAELVLRLLPDDSGSVMRFGVKFGAPYSHIQSLLETAKKLDLKVIGTSFHIGSGCFDPQSYYKAIQLCRETFDMAEKLKMPRFTFLDLGGGFPGTPAELVNKNNSSGNPSFEQFAAVIRTSLAEFFPKESNSHVKIIAEPGRYMATAWSALFTYVQGKREEPIDPKNPNSPRKFLYYINDGVYGALNCIMFDHAHPQPIPAYRFMNDRISLDRGQQFTTASVPGTHHSIPVPTAMYANLFNSSISSSASHYASARGVHNSPARRDANCLGTFFGPTCDSMDVIVTNTPMEELFVGDWVGFECMGAYTSAASSTFNGMAKAATFYCRSKQSSPVVANLPGA